MGLTHEIERAEGTESHVQVSPFYQENRCSPRRNKDLQAFMLFPAWHWEDLPSKSVSLAAMHACTLLHPSMGQREDGDGGYMEKAVRGISRQLNFSHGLELLLPPEPS